MSDPKQLTGLKKASEKLRKKLESDEKVSLKSYTLSKTNEPPSQEQVLLSKNPHAVKPHRKGFRMSTVALKKLQKVYVSRYSENPKITHSALICEAVDLLFSKQNRKKTEIDSDLEQSDFFS